MYWIALCQKMTHMYICFFQNKETFQFAALASAARANGSQLVILFNKELTFILKRQSKYWDITPASYCRLTEPIPELATLVRHPRTLDTPCHQSWISQKLLRDQHQHPGTICVPRSQHLSHLIGRNTLTIGIGHVALGIQERKVADVLIKRHKLLCTLLFAMQNCYK